jgi:hypothetical protein
LTVRNLQLGPLLASLAFALGACGSDDSEDGEPVATDEEQITAVVDSYNAAVEDRDAGSLCREVVPRSSLGDQSESECEATLGRALRKSPEGYRPLSELSDIEVSGDQATASATQENGAPLSPRFLREEGRWWMSIYD